MAGRLDLFISLFEPVVMEYRPSCVLDKYSTTGLYLQSYFLLVLKLGARSHRVSLELTLV